MRTWIIVIFSTLLLSACTMGKQSSDLNVTPDMGVPPEAKVQSGYEYPAIPLDEYNQMNSGANLPAEAPTAPAE